MVRSEERVRAGVERLPVERVRLRKRVVTEEVTRTVQVRREELVVEHEPIDAGAGAQGGDAEVPTAEIPLEMVLRREEVVLDVRPVAVQRVRVWVERVAGDAAVEAEVRREEIRLEEE